MQPKKLEPLKCPKCESTSVAKGFTKRKKSAFTVDNHIYCYDCKQKTNTDSGKAENFREEDYPFRKELADEYEQITGRRSGKASKETRDL